MISILESFDVQSFKDQAIWNPLCAGTILSLLAFFGNLEGGCAVVDCQAQLRIVLYLYHSLFVNGCSHDGQIPMLYLLYAAFKECKAI
jgi:hypothetical protein